MKRLEVERSALRVWMLALLGIPFVLVGLDLLTEHRFVNAFASLVYGTEQIPPFEPRDKIFAILALASGLILVLWGLRDLIAPRKLLVADESGMGLALGGPFRRPTWVRWADIRDVHADTVDEDGDVLSVLLIQFEDTSRIPPDPWSARWVGSQTLMIRASGWSRDAGSVAADIRTMRETMRPDAAPWS
jgi:hypothetical protein